MTNSNARILNFADAFGFRERSLEQEGYLLRIQANESRIGILGGNLGEVAPVILTGAVWRHLHYGRQTVLVVARPETAGKMWLDSAQNFARPSAILSICGEGRHRRLLRGDDATRPVLQLIGQWRDELPFHGPHDSFDLVFGDFDNTDTEFIEQALQWVEQGSGRPQVIVAKKRCLRPSSR